MNIHNLVFSLANVSFEFFEYGFCCLPRFVFTSVDLIDGSADILTYSFNLHNPVCSARAYAAHTTLTKDFL